MVRIPTGIARSSRALSREAPCWGCPPRGLPWSSLYSGLRRRQHRTGRGRGGLSVIPRRRSFRNPAQAQRWQGRASAVVSEEQQHGRRGGDLPAVEDPQDYHAGESRVGRLERVPSCGRTEAVHPGWRPAAPQLLGCGAPTLASSDGWRPASASRRCLRGNRAEAGSYVPLL